MGEDPVFIEAQIVGLVVAGIGAVVIAVFVLVTRFGIRAGDKIRPRQLSGLK